MNSNIARMFKPPIRTSRSARTKLFATWILRVLLAFVFIFTGYQKLAGDAAMTVLFEHIGVGSWFQYVTGGFEIAAGVLLLVPTTGLIGGLLVVAIMAGATLTNLTVPGIDQPIAKDLFPLVLLAPGAFVAWQNRRPVLDLLMLTRTPK